MTDATQIRQKVQQARELAKQGKPAQAKAVLKGIQHPKVTALVAQLDEAIAAQPRSGKFPVLPVVGMVAVLVVFAGGMVLLSVSRQRPSETERMLPTLIPTADCSEAAVQMWWQTQDAALTGFAADASSASRTMPGERLTGQISRLHDFRDNFPPLPVCASLDRQRSVQEVLAAMDKTIIAADRWNSGQVDGTQSTHEFDAAETALREAKTRVVQAFGQ
jgi:hypothetical protein